MSGDLIFVSMEDWDDIWRRNQFLCAGLARRYPASKILFVGTGLHVFGHLRSGSFAGLLPDAPQPVNGYTNLLTSRPLRLAPERFLWGRRLNAYLARRHVRRAARRLGIRSPLLWINPYYAAHMAGRMGEKAAVYDITDDWELAANSKAAEDAIVADDRELCRRADLVVVCSEALGESRRRVARRILLLPNGVDADHYQSVAARAAAGGDASPAGERPGPVFGYTGTLHPARIDVDVVVAVARAFPAGTVLLVGPDHLDPAHRDRLRAEPNVQMPGPVAYAQIPACMAEFEVCIVPHRETDFTESLNPIKLWEYLASGLPIVSTNVAGFRDYPHLCELATGAAGFVEACRRALARRGDRPLAQARVAEAQRNSWDRRLDRLVDALADIGV